MNSRDFENSINNIKQLLDPWGYIILLKYETTLEKHLMILQNLTFYNTSHEILYIIAKASSAHVFLITLRHLDPIVEN